VLSKYGEAAGGSDFANEMSDRKLLSSDESSDLVIRSTRGDDSTASSPSRAAFESEASPLWTQNSVTRINSLNMFELAIG
jgi:hypothetical protein